MCMLFTSAQKGASRKKWHILVCSDWFPWSNHYFIALEVLYNMSMVPSFSIEWYPSYTQLNISAKIIILRINPSIQCIDNYQYRSCKADLNSEALKAFLKVSGVMKQPAPMIIHQGCWKSAMLESTFWCQNSGWHRVALIVFTDFLLWFLKLLYSNDVGMVESIVSYYCNSHVIVSSVVLLWWGYDKKR